LQLAQLDHDSGEIDAAIANYEKAASLQPKSASVRTLIGNLYLEKGNLDRAGKNFGQALVLDPNFAAAANNLAWIYAKQGVNLDVALSLAQKAKERLPNLESVSDTLAWIYYQKGDYAGAVQLLKECVEKVPSDATFHYHLGMILKASGDNGKAKQQLATALGLKLGGDDALQASKALSQLN